MSDILLKANKLNFIRELDCDRCAADILVFLLKEPESEYNSRQIAAAVTSPFFVFVIVAAYAICFGYNPSDYP
jgi:hypothetical protein